MLPEKNKDFESRPRYNNEINNRIKGSMEDL